MEEFVLVLYRQASDDTSPPLSCVTSAVYICTSCNNSVHRVLAMQAITHFPSLPAIQGKIQSADCVLLFWGLQQN